jgi:diguanylate cyclase (GGDEF)-like protein/PAS domain S-box-containing protein
MKLKLNLEDKILKLQKWIEKIKENREVFIIIVMVILLCFIVCMSEVLYTSYFLLGTLLTSFNWRKALFLIIPIIFFGILVIAIIIRFVRESKKEKETLLKSQQEFVSLFNSSPEALVYLDEKGNIINMNPRFTELFGYTLKEIKGRNIDEGMIHPPEKIEEIKYLLKEALSGNYINYETIRKKKDGTLFPVSISGSRVMLDGKLQGTIGIYRDITERKQDEQLQQVLYNISKAANSALSLDQLYPLIHQELGSIIDTTNFYIALVDEKEDKIFFPYHVDERDDNFPILNFSTANTLTAYVIKNGQPLLNDNNQYEEMINQGILSPWGSTTPQSIWLGVPLKIEDKTIGVMAVQSYTHPDLYSEKDIKLLEFVSSQVATAIERKRIEEKIRYLSFHDALTDLYSRAYFEEELERYNFPRYYPLSIMMVDVNGLKVINDTFGHHEGDRLLQHFASLLNSISRKGDVIARLGGDEFAILLPSTTSPEAHRICERIRKICEEDSIKPVYLRPSTALGHATQKEEYQDTKALLKEADKRMYQDKNKNKVKETF